MDNHKLVMISIFYFLKHEKDAIFIFFYEKYVWKNFRIWPYAIKYFFFLKMFWIFLKKYFEENRVF
jgi:hypothetical protein